MRNPGLSELGRRTTDPPISWLMRLALERPQLISLAAGFTDDLSLPVEETKALLVELLTSPKASRAALQYGSTPGHPRLRELTADRIRSQDNVAEAEGPYSGDNVFITHGSQQLLYLATECLCDPGDIVLVEDPTYFVFLGILQSHGLQARGIPLEHDGLDIQAMKRALHRLAGSGDVARVKMLYMVTYFQNPTGITTRWEKKEAALDVLRYYERAAGHPIYLLEDAAYRDLRFEGADVPSALSLDRRHDRVLYAGTYSKPYATGVRVGYGLAPSRLLPVLARVKGNHDFGTANFLQHLLVRVLESSEYAHHLVTLRKRYRAKAQLMTSALRRHFPPSVAWDDPRGGMYVWARLPRRSNTGPKAELFQRALSRDVLYVPGQLCYAPDPGRPVPRNEMRLSFGNATEADIRRGVGRLGEVMQDFCEVF